MRHFISLGGEYGTFLTTSGLRYQLCFHVATHSTKFYPYSDGADMAWSFRRFYGFVFIIR
jgi:hypothetical protein